MLRTRLVVGSLMAAAALGVLYADQSRGPHYPGLFALTLAVGWLAAHELLGLLPTATRPRADLVTWGVLSVLAANWAFVLFGRAVDPRYLRFADPWHPVLAAFVVALILAFLLEMASYEAPGASTTRVAHAVLTVAYLGLLPSFLVKLRWLPAHSGLALALAIFVPKCGDVGAYFAGRLFGRTPMSPRISPKKTWEGFAGGTALAVASAVGLGELAAIFPGGAAEAAGFGLAVGWAGAAGDLAASMLKRDAAVKDASAAVPGFGGVVDVVDSVVFAAPVAYLWLTR